MALIWLALFALLLVIEAISVGLVSIWFAAGSLGGLVASLLGAPVWLQIIVFGVVSALALLLLRPIAKKYVNDKVTPTNIDSLKGKVFKALTDIGDDDNKGQVKVNDLEWTAVSEDGSLIEKGTKVVVKDIQGTRLVVARASGE